MSLDNFKLSQTDLVVTVTFTRLFPVYFNSATKQREKDRLKFTARDDSGVTHVFLAENNAVRACCGFRDLQVGDVIRMSNCDYAELPQWKEVYSLTLI